MLSIKVAGNAKELTLLILVLLLLCCCPRTLLGQLALPLVGKLLQIVNRRYDSANVNVLGNRCIKRFNLPVMVAERVVKSFDDWLTVSCVVEVTELVRCVGS